jgi:hypothetical protein
MNTNTSLGILAVLTLLVGCATQPRGPAYGHEQEFRRQIGESVPIKEWGYKTEQIRFSADYHKALVVFAVPGKTNVTEVVLEEDGFRRYRAGVTDWGRMEGTLTTLRSVRRSDAPVSTKSTLAALDSAKASICVTFPNTRGSAYRHEPEFRRQLMNSVPVKDWGYQIQEIRFSGDSRKALVLCFDPDAAESREFILEDDGFRRFRCPLYDEKRDFRVLGSVTVTLPDK